MQIFKKETIIFSIIVILSAVVIVLIGQNYVFRQNLIIAENAVKTRQYNEKILNFTKLFISKILKASGEVSFDDRLELENAVRGINDKTIFEEWQKFVNAKTQLEAQIEVKNLLEILINKIGY